MKYYQIINETNNDLIAERSANQLLFDYDLRDEIQRSLHISKLMEKYQKYNPSYKLTIRVIEETREPEVPFYCLPNFGWPQK